MNDFACYFGTCNLVSDATLLLSGPLWSLGDTFRGLDISAPWFLPLIAGITGALMGSLSGLVADRLPAIRGWNREVDPGLSLSYPPSHCPACKRRLHVSELVPVIGYLLAKGRCQGCDSRIPPTYPIVEGTVAILSLVIASVLEPSFEMVCILGLLWYLTAVSWLDWSSEEIPDMLTLPLIFAGALLSPFDDDPMSRILGAGIAALAMLIVFKAVSSAMEVDAQSYGDVALAAAGGAWCGVCGGVPMLIVSSFAYIAYALPLRRKGVVWVPMGPAISAGILIVLTFGITI